MSMTLSIKPLQKSHVLGILNGFTQENSSLDKFISKYLRKHSSIGSKERKIITEIVYKLVRWKLSIDSWLKKPSSWEERLSLFLEHGLEKIQKNPDMKDFEKASFPKELYQHLQKQWSKEEVDNFCRVTNEKAPITVRVNVLKTTREALYTQWKSDYPVTLCKNAKHGITFSKAQPFPAFPSYKNGFFEVQDEASQLVADLVDPKPGDWILDYCAGAGGKSLSFAHKTQGKGKIFLHDIRKNSLISAQKRFQRAGIKNAECIFHQKFSIKKFKNKMNWLLLDVPCSGSGTWRRHAEQKWKFSLQRLQEFVLLQRGIVKKSLKNLKPGGFLLYATCSIFTEENESQVDWICKNFSMQLVNPFYQTHPQSGQMDGFFAALLTTKNS